MEHDQGRELHDLSYFVHIFTQAVLARYFINTYGVSRGKVQIYYLNIRAK